MFEVGYLTYLRISRYLFYFLGYFSFLFPTRSFSPLSFTFPRCFLHLLFLVFFSLVFLGSLSSSYSRVLLDPRRHTQTHIYSQEPRKKSWKTTLSLSSSEKKKTEPTWMNEKFILHMFREGGFCLLIDIAIWRYCFSQSSIDWITDEQQQSEKTPIYLREYVQNLSNTYSINSLR